MSTAAALEFVQAAKDAGCPPDQVRNFASAGIVLQPRQLEFAAKARLCDLPGGPTEVALGGARGPGKSHAIVAQLGDDCLRHPGLKCLLLRKVGASAREGFEALLPKTVGRLGRYAASNGIFRFGNGSWIRLGHFQNESDIDKYLGLEYDVIALEEATTLTAAKKTAVFSCCRSPTDSGWRARKYLSTNPGGVGHAWFKERFVGPHRLAAESDTRFVPCTVRDNRFAAPEYVKFLEGLTGWLRRAWLDGDWDIAAGQYFTTWRRDLHVVPRASVPDDWQVWGGLDYGFTHYTTFYLLAKDSDGNVFAVDEHAERRWLIPRHASAIQSLLDRNGVAASRLRGVFAGGDVFDTRHNGASVAADYAEEGLRLVRANTDRPGGAAEVLARLGDVEADPPVSPRLFVSESCRRLIECIPSLEHDPHRPEDVLKVDTDEEGRGGDDPYDALRYGVMADVRPKSARAKAAPLKPGQAPYRVA